jgi:hypothetical protein
VSRKRSIIKSTGWDGAIQLAKREIEKLETSIRVFERNKDAGEPWPGDEQFKRQQQSEQHAI